MHYPSVSVLYRHASFYVVSSADVMSSLKLGAEDLPAVFMVSEDDEGVQRYTGEILELNLSEWVLKHSSPGMGELTLNSASGKTHHVHSAFAVRLWEVSDGVLSAWLPGAAATQLMCRC
jgi:hypothetical protein